MNTLTYQDYIDYLKYIFNQYDPSEFNSDEELEYYHLLKSRLENSKSLPVSVLSSPILANANLDKETLQAISEIKSLAAKDSSTNSWLSSFVKKISKGFSIEFDNNKLVGLAISFVFVTVFSFISFLFPDINGLLLSGAAGSGGSENLNKVDTLLTANVGLGSSLLAVTVLIFVYINNKKR